MLPLESGRPEAPDPVPARSTRPAAAPPAAPGAGRGLPAPPASVATPDVVGLLKALRRRWLLALTAGLLCAGVAAAAAWYTVPTPPYWTSAVLRVLPQSRLMFPTVADGYAVDQMASLKSRVVLNAALRKPEVAALGSVLGQVDPVEWLSGRLRPGVEGQFLRIGMLGEDPNELVVLVNAVADAFLSEVVESEAAAKRTHFDNLRRIYETCQEGLRTKKGRLRSLAEQAGSKNQDTLAYKNQLALERHNDAVRELMSYEAEMRRAQVELKLLTAAASPRRGRGPDPITAEMVDKGVEAAPEVRRLLDEAARWQAEIDNVGRVAVKSNDAARRGAMAALRRVRQQLEAARAEARPRVVEELRQLGRDGQAARRLADVRQRIDMLKELIAVAEAGARKLDAGTKALSRTTLDLETIQEEIGQAEQVAKAIGAQVEVLNIELQAPPRIRLYEKAELPRTRPEAKPAKTAGLAGLGTFALVLFGVSWLEFQARRIRTMEEVSRGLGLKLLGSLPTLPHRMRGRGGIGPEDARYRALNSLLIESVDAIRTMLLHGSRAESLRTLMIASALGGEGKTSLASHLAISIARSGRRALLIDCDLRRPMAHRLFDVPLEPGFSEVLRGGCVVDAAIRPTSVAGLDMIPAGRCDDAAIQALARDELGAIFDYLKRRYDLIVVDSAPVLPVADSLEIGQHVDAVVFSILRDVSRTPKVYDAYERLAALGIRTLGAVVAGAPGHGYGYRYGYGYGYGRRNQLPAGAGSEAPSASRGGAA